MKDPRIAPSSRFAEILRRCLSWEAIYSGAVSFDIAHKFRFGRVLIIAVAPFFAGYAVLFHISGYPVPAALMLYGAFAALTGIILAATPRGTRVWERWYFLMLSIGFFLPLGAVHLLVIWMYGRVDYLSWVSLYPLLALFLLGEKKGIAVVIVVLAVVSVLLAFPRPGVVLAVSVPNMKVQFGLSLVVAGVISTLYEITRRIAQDRLLASEASLRQSNVALADAGAESRRLASEAERANRSKSAFIANVSHELRTPLNHIIGFTDLVLEGSAGTLNESQNEYLRDVAFSARHLLSLIDDVLDFSKVEAARLELRVTEVSLGSLLERCAVMVQERARRQGLTVEIDAREAPARIRADERRLRQIVYNLLSNAGKFTPEGGRATVRARMREQGSASNCPSGNPAHDGGCGE